MYIKPQVNEADWKLFRRKLPDWQEAYMDRLNHEYIELLKGQGRASDIFWGLDKRIRRDRQSVGVVARMSRSNMEYNILALLCEEVISLADLDDFSEELRERMAFLTRDRSSADATAEEDYTE